MNADGSGQRRLTRNAVRASSRLVARRAEDRVRDSRSLRRGRPQLDMVRRVRRERRRQRTADGSDGRGSRFEIAQFALRCPPGRRTGE